MPPHRRDWLAVLALVLITVAVFLPSTGYGFVNFDDHYYVITNHNVTDGLSLSGLRWAFTTDYLANWHPLTWLSLQSDATLWKQRDGTVDARGFHVTNVVIHAANAALLFLSLRALTGAYWQSVVVALLFAVHPLRVESVTWVSERKDVLSAFFGLLALRAYAGFAARPGIARYLTVAVLFALSLLAKPMLVTLPCLFLVLDWWPLQRATSRKSFVRLAAEKIPLVLLVAGVSVLTLWAQNNGGAVRSLDIVPFDDRVRNALLSYVVYLRQSFWPTNLVVFYALVGNLPAGSAIAAGLFLVAITATAVALRRRAPYLLAGWLWYLGMLVPVIGLVQVGTQAHADRYTYLPQAGIWIAFVWGAAALVGSRPRSALAMAGSAALALAVLTWNQQSWWHDSITLWTRDAEVDRNNPLAWYNLGSALQEKEDWRGAAVCFAKSLQIAPTYKEALLGLGVLQRRLGNLVDATRQFEQLCKVDPDSAAPRFRLGETLIDRNALAEAARQYEIGIRLAPEQAEGYVGLGKTEMMRKEMASATRHFRKALELDPNSAPAYCGLALVLLSQQRPTEAIDQLNLAIRCRPEESMAHLLLGKVLESNNDLSGAEVHLLEAARLEKRLPTVWNALGTLRFRQKRLVEAADCYAQAVELSPGSNIFRSDLSKALSALEKSGHAEEARRIKLRLQATFSPGATQPGQTTSTD